MNKATNAIGLAKQVSEAKAALTEQKKLLVNERAALFAERHALEIAPVPVEDIKKLLFAQIDQRAEVYAACSGIREQVKRAMYPSLIGHGARRPWEVREALNMRDVDAALAGDSSVLEHQSLSSKVAGFDGALCYFLGDVIKARLAEEWEAHPVRHSTHHADCVGAPISDRRPRMEAIEKRLSEIDGACRAIDEEAKILGAVVPGEDLIEPEDRFANRDAVILADLQKSQIRQDFIGQYYAWYGLSPDYAAYLQRHAEQRASTERQRQLRQSAEDRRRYELAKVHGTHSAVRREIEAAGRTLSEW